MNINVLPIGIRHLRAGNEDVITVRALRVRPDGCQFTILVMAVVLAVGLAVSFHHALFKILSMPVTPASIIAAIFILLLIPAFRDNPFLKMFLRVFETESLRISNECMYLERRGLFTLRNLCIRRDELKELRYECPPDNSFFDLALVFQPRGQELQRELLAFTIHRRYKADLFQLLRQILERHNWQVAYHFQKDTA